MTIDIEKIKETLVGELLAQMLAKDGIGLIQETGSTIEESGDVNLKIKVTTREGETLFFYMGVSTEEPA